LGGAPLPATAAEPGDPERPWEALKQFPGQAGAEVYAIATASAALAAAAAFDAAARMLPGARWHWLWLAPAALVGAFALLHAAVAVSAAAGWVLRKLGVLRCRLPHEASSFCFLCGATAYAATASASGRPVAVIGSLWLALVTANLAAAVYLAMKKAEGHA
jgi:hypothetical protein